jgi:hypothetical protein
MTMIRNMRGTTSTTSAGAHRCSPGHGIDARDGRDGLQSRARCARQSTIARCRLTGIVGHTDPVIPPDPRRFSDLRPPYDGYWPWMLRLDAEEDARGRLTQQQLASIGERPDALALWVNGLDQASFEQVITRYGKQFLAIELDKCPRITDLSPLEDLPRLRLVDIFWNQRATRLWDLSRNPDLVGLRFNDFTRLHDLDNLPAAASLLELEFGDAIWSTSTYESLEPLTALRSLRSLSFNPKRIDDGRIEPVGELTGLEELDIPTNMFTTQQFAWLRSRLPDTVKSDVLGPVIEVRPFEEGGKVKDVLLVGKRKPFLSSVADQGHIKKHVDEFWQMVHTFRRDPALGPDQAAAS